MSTVYQGENRRQFSRLNYVKPLTFKVCKKKTVTALLKGYTSNISPAGLLCNIKDRVKKNDTLWLCFDRDVLGVCEDLEKRSLIYQNGVVGKVIRVKSKSNGSYDVGIQFLTREEKNLTNIYPKSYFIAKQMKNANV